MDEFNFDQTITDLGKLYEEGKDTANRMFPIVPQDQPAHAKILEILQKLRDMCATTAQAFKAFQEAAGILKPHPDYDFVHEDQVFIDNGDGSKSFFLLIYAPQTADWVLIPYTDVSFNTPLENEQGKVMGEPLSAFGYEVLERVEDFDIEELK